MKSIYAIIGDDEASKEMRINALKDLFFETSGGNNVEIYDANITEPSYLLMNLTTLSLFGGKRLVILRNFDAWGEGVKKTPTPTDEEINDFISYIKNPQEDTTILITGIRFPKKLLIWKEFFKTVKEEGKVLEYLLPKDWEMGAWTQNIAQELGLSITKANAELIVEMVGKDSLGIKSELNKINQFLRKEEKVVTEKIINEVVYKRPKAAEYKMLEALSKGDINKAFTMLNETIDARVPINRMIYPITKEIRMLIFIRNCMEEDLNNDSIAMEIVKKGFYKMKPTNWAIDQLRKRANGYTMPQLIKALWTICELDYSLKGGTQVKRPFQLSYEFALYSIIQNEYPENLTK